MFATDPAIASLLVFLNVAPIGLYFLTLGLVNSHPRPYRVSSRADFLALTVVCVPLLVWPVPELVAARMWWLIAAALTVMVFGFVRLLPRHGDGWVIYNMTEQRFRRTLEEAAASLGLRGVWRGRTWIDSQAGLAVRYSCISILRNVSVTLSPRRGARTEWEPRLAAALDEGFARCAQLPSASGAMLVMLGAVLLCMPVWVLGRHAHEVAEAVARLFG